MYRHEVLQREACRAWTEGGAVLEVSVQSGQLHKCALVVLYIADVHSGRLALDPELDAKAVMAVPDMDTAHAAYTAVCANLANIGGDLAHRADIALETAQTFLDA